MDSADEESAGVGGAAKANASQMLAEKANKTRRNDKCKRARGLPSPHQSDNRKIHCDDFVGTDSEAWMT